MVKAKKFVYAKAFQGEPTSDNFRLEEFDLPELKDGDVLCKAEYLSVDPYIRPYMTKFPVGSTMICGQVAKVEESKDKSFPVGSYICGHFGWQTQTVFSMDKFKTPDMVANQPYILQDFGGLPNSLALGVLGMPGRTAYFGFLEICQPKAGETVVVSAAGGAVGSLVGQIAKLKGCTVIGFAGTDDKCKWLTSQLGFDYAINYKKDNVLLSLKEAAPKGVDCYFDNVGGELSSVIISQMKFQGRISVCGAITAYNADITKMPKATVIQPAMVFQQLKMEGFVVNRWSSRNSEATNAMLKWVKEGKIKYRETVTNGFENMPTAFMGMLNGKNTGKAVVKI